MWSFVLASIIIELTPGANMTWLAVLGATRGRKVALAAVAGICIGLAIAAAVAGLGLTTVLSRYPELLTALRWAGTLYLLYLAWEAWTDSDKGTASANTSVAASFRQGLISNMLNPKAYLFYAAMLPPFIKPDADATQQVVLLSAIYVGIATIIHAGIAIASGSVADWLEKSPQAVIVRKSLAVLIAAAAIWFFYSTRVSQ
jgi:threonine/homoserine/homoserine lactone efflux protein